MNKKLLVILAAALVALSATACTEEGSGETDTDATGTKNPNESYIVVDGTDEDGNPVTSVDPDTAAPETEGFDPTEDNPTFTDVSKQVVVFTAVATVRTSTQIVDNNAVGWPSEGKILEVTGESDNWYRIKYPVNGTETECYIAKTVAADASVLDTFTAIENGEEVMISVEAVNVRSYPSTASDNSIRASLKYGAKVIRVAVNDQWSRIIFEVVSETETDAEGNPVKEQKMYYISNDCLAVTTETPVETVAETTAE